MGVKSSATVFRALRMLATQGHPTGAADVAHALGVPISTAVRALATLEAAGYAERHGGAARFVIGKSARALAFAFMAQFPVRDLAMPYLQQLTLEGALTSSLFVRLGWFAVRVGRILGPSVLIHRSPLGERLPLHAGAPSLAMLAHMTEAERARVLLASTAPEARTAAARTRKAVLRGEAAVERSLTDAGASDIAMPLLDAGGRVVAAIALEGAPAGAVPALADPDGAARRVMAELAARIRGEEALDLSHYGHIDPDQIAF